MKHPLPAALTGSLGVLCALLGGCSARTDVSLTGNTPAQYTHVYVTAKELWFNGNASAGPDDSGWQKFPLSTPSTVDLVTDEGGTLGTLVNSLNLLGGTYSQIRLIPVDPSAPLTTSAQTLGARYNAEADYVDGAGVTQQLRLELLNPDKGIGIPASLHVPVGSVGSAFGAVTSPSGALGTTDAMSSAGTADATGTTSGTGTTVSTTSTSTTTASFAINMDGTRDLVPFSFGPAATRGILLSSHATAYDLAEVGGISGTLTLTNLTGTSTVSGLPNIQVDAQTLSADGTRHVVVLSAPVHSDGTFLLYPLPTSSSTAATYDLVIHGAGIATIIIKAVAVTIDSSTTNTTSNTTTTNSPISDAITPSANPVSIGTLTPRAATSYTANITTAAGSPLPAGALVSFYQTLGGSGEVPYVIEASPIDPFNQVLVNAQGLSAATIDSGTFVASGDTVNLVSAAPQDGAGTYLVAASAPAYADGVLTSKVNAPKTGTGPATVTVPTLTAASGATGGSVVAEVSTATPGKYDQGELLVSREGQLVAQTALDAVLAAGGRVSASVPAGLTTSAYYVSVRVWKSSDPGGTLQRQWYPAAVDLRNTSSGAIALTIN